MLDPVAGVGAAARIWGSDLAGQVFTDHRGTLDTAQLLRGTTNKQATFYQAQPGTPRRYSKVAFRPKLSQSRSELVTARVHSARWERAARPSERGGWEVTYRFRWNAHSEGGLLA